MYVCLYYNFVFCSGVMNKYILNHDAKNIVFFILDELQPFTRGLYQAIR